MSNELIYIVSLSILCIFWSYRFWKLEKLVFTQFDKILNFQHDVIDMIDRLKIVEVEHLTRSSNNENKKNEERNTNE